MWMPTAAVSNNLSEIWNRATAERTYPLIAVLAHNSVIRSELSENNSLGILCAIHSRFIGRRSDPWVTVNKLWTYDRDIESRSIHFQWLPVTWVIVKTALYDSEWVMAVMQYSLRCGENLPQRSSTCPIRVLLKLIKIRFQIRTLSGTEVKIRFRWRFLGTILSPSNLCKSSSFEMVQGRPCQYVQTSVNNINMALAGQVRHW